MIETSRVLGARYARLNDAIRECNQFTKSLSRYADVDGVHLVTNAVGDLVRSLYETANELSKELKARKECFAPYATQYHHKMVFFEQEVSNIKRRIATQSNVIAQKRLMLMEDNVPLDAALLAYPNYDPTPDLAKIEALEAEKESWVRFGRYELPEYLPTTAIRENNAPA
jgi:hypothetical protein